MPQAAGYDFAIQATGGLMSVTGEKDGTPGSEPQKVGVAVADLFTGLYATTAILAALRQAEPTGRGCHIDAALLDVQVAMLANQASNHLVGGITPSAWAMPTPTSCPTRCCPRRTATSCWRWATTASSQRFCQLAGRPEVAPTRASPPIRRASGTATADPADRRLDARAHHAAMVRPAGAQRRALMDMKTSPLAGR
jgi:crotonobetainyl-CoA:carnitine CoA-transferase CaiB-like acyl-CoA transferase